jgi:hypothetical protein
LAILSIFVFSGCLREDNFAFNPDAPNSQLAGGNLIGSSYSEIEAQNNDSLDDYVCCDEAQDLRDGEESCEAAISREVASSIETSTLTDLFPSPEIDFDGISFVDFVGNPAATGNSPEEDGYIKRAIINIILYMHNIFAEDFSSLTIAVDEERSVEWFSNVLRNWIARNPEEREGWTIVNEIKLARELNEEHGRALAHLDTNFIVFAIEENLLNITVRFFQLCLASGQESGSLHYSFVFAKIDGRYKVIGMALES